MQGEKIASNRKRAVTRTKLAGWVIAGMVIIAGGMIVVVLTHDSRPPEAVARGQRPIIDQSTTTPPADTAAPVKPRPPQQEAAADERSTGEESTKESVHTKQAAAISVLHAQVALISGGWRCGHETLSAALTWWQCDRYVDRVHLLVGFEGDAALKSFSFMALFPTGIAPETTERVWEAGTVTAAGLLPGAELAIAEARASAIEQPHGLAGSAKTPSGWRIWTVERLDEIRYAEWAAEGNLVVSIEAMAPDSTTQGINP